MSFIRKGVQFKQKLLGLESKEMRISLRNLLDLCLIFGMQEINGIAHQLLNECFGRKAMKLLSMFQPTHIAVTQMDAKLWMTS